MPLLIQLSKDLLTPNGEREVFSRVAAAMLEVHGLSGNTFMTPNVIGHVQVSPEGTSYAGGKAQSLAVVEVKAPGMTFPNHKVQQDFVTRVTNIIDELKMSDHPRSRTFVNVTHAQDGSWGIAGKAYTNAELGQAIESAAR
jgi:hypothetical protein